MATWSALKKKLTIDSRFPGGFFAQASALDSHLETLTCFETERSGLDAAIDIIAADDEVSSYGELARAIRLLNKTANMRIDAYFISDMQQTSLPSKGFVDCNWNPAQRSICIRSPSLRRKIGRWRTSRWRRKFSIRRPAA